jgi:hypothetical protein
MDDQPHCIDTSAALAAAAAAAAQMLVAACMSNYVTQAGALSSGSYVSVAQNAMMLADQDGRRHRSTANN